MPFNAAEIAILGKASLDAYMRNKPVDQIGYQHPFLSKLVKSKKSCSGGLQFIVEQIRKSYDSNFQHYHGSDNVTFNSRDSLEQASYAWGSVFDGFQLNEDELLTNGVSFNDSTRNAATRNDKIQLTQLFNEHMEVLRLGMEEQLDLALHRDGTQDANAVAGLDHLLNLTPAVGTVGGLNAATFAFWRNQAAPGLTAANIIDTMEVQWRQCIRNGGTPDCIMMGSDALDVYRNATKAEIGRYTILNTGGETPTMDPSVTNLHFKNVPIHWNPTHEHLDLLDAPAAPWEKRIYMLNTRHIKYRPIKGHDMQSRKPQRHFDSFNWYWGITHKYALTMNRRNAHSVMSVA